MKVFVKSLKGTHFEIDVKPDDTVADVKQKIEDLQGPDVYPAFKQMLIYQGRVLEDDTTLKENKVAENSFLVTMLTKSKRSPGEGSTKSNERSRKVSQNTGGSPRTSKAPQAPVAVPAPVLVPVAAPAPAPAHTSVANATSEAGVRDQEVSNLVAGSNLEETIQQIVDMGGGIWDRDIVTRALRAASNNPERAIEYLYSGLPEQAEVPRVTRIPISGPDENPTEVPLQPAAIPTLSGGPNPDPIDLFPQIFRNLGSNGPLDFLRNSQQFQALRAMVQASPQILQPMLQELGKQNPNLVRLIQEHQAAFLRLLNEPFGAEDGNIMSLFASAMPQAIQVTPSERAAIERLEAMGFDRSLVLEVFFACNKNEELAANYLLDHIHEFED